MLASTTRLSLGGPGLYLVAPSASMRTTWHSTAPTTQTVYGQAGFRNQCFPPTTPAAGTLDSSPPSVPRMLPPLQQEEMQAHSDVPLHASLHRLRGPTSSHVLSPRRAEGLLAPKFTNQPSTTGGTPSSCTIPWPAVLRAHPSSNRNIYICCSPELRCTNTGY